MSEDLAPSGHEIARPTAGDPAVSSDHPERQPLSISDFIDDESGTPDSFSLPPRQENSLPLYATIGRSLGPGFREAIAWTAGVFAGHLALSIGLLLVISIVSAVYLVAAEQIKDPKVLEQRLAIGPTGHSILVCGEQWLMVALTILAIRLRMGRHTTRQLNLDKPHLYQFLIVSFLVLPLGGLADLTYRLASIPWDVLKENVALLKALDQLNMVEQMQTITASIPLPLLILAISISPAISEELVFRGLFVRGLLARWGVWWTMLISSVCFALIHTHPLHVAAVFPIGMALFWIYYTTRNFWLPMWLHMLNNLLSILVMQSQGNLEEIIQEASSSQVAFQAAIALTGTALALWLLHKNRTKYVNSSGELWNPPAAPMSSPPAELGFQRHVPVVGIPLVFICAGLTLVMVYAQFSSSVEANPGSNEIQSPTLSEPEVT